METAERTWTVTAALSGARLDKALVDLAGVGELSRARVKRAIDAGSVRVNGRVRAKGAVVEEGDVISLQGDANNPDVPALPEPGAPLDVVHESAAVLIVHKPAGQPTAPLAAGETGTLANAILARFPETAGVGHSPREPGLVHRLDTDTSGLVLVARTAAAFAELKEALRDQRLEKRYLLVCAGADLQDAGSIAFPLANHPKDQRRVLACIHPRDVARNAPRPAHTKFEVKQRRDPWALVEVSVAKALRHQIRAHFAALEHPLAGDVLYGGPSASGLARHALHAARIQYRGGAVVPPFDASAPLPADMAQLMAPEGEG